MSSSLQKAPKSANTGLESAEAALFRLINLRNVSSIVRQLGTEFREQILAPWAVDSVDSRRTRLPTLPTAPTTATVC